ncbi:hypothetical protein NF672_19200 [Pseudomonas moraviensis]|uniref:hypothetical protein n=1 Tax=Pseudomonas moraviensis TaxID=321662 RepID=UPI002093C687|nr:hypothetical protein [Pseudomonas moraviensis]UST57561.1 hypothetical protein NF672_19200 [Pseudomonas moraviensis]
MLKASPANRPLLHCLHNPSVLAAVVSTPQNAPQIPLRLRHLIRRQPRHMSLSRQHKSMSTPDAAMVAR